MLTKRIDENRNNFNDKNNQYLIYYYIEKHV